MTRLIWLAISTVAMATPTPIFGHKGSPQKVSCSANYLLAKKPITQKTDINELLDGHETVQLDDVHPDCHKYQDKVVTCEATIDSEKLSMRYAFNTQNGNLEVNDLVTGQSAYQYWTNEYQLTESGYLTTGVWLTNTSGGLMGNDRAFQIEFHCQAVNGDW